MLLRRPQQGRGWTVPGALPIPDAAPGLQEGSADPACDRLLFCLFNFSRPARCPSRHGSIPQPPCGCENNALCTCSVLFAMGHVTFLPLLSCFLLAGLCGLAYCRLPLHSPVVLLRTLALFPRLRLRLCEEPGPDLGSPGSQALPVQPPDMAISSPAPTPNPGGAPSLSASPVSRPAVIRSPAVSPGSSSASWSVVPPMAPPPGPLPSGPFGPCSRWCRGSLSPCYRPRGFGLAVASPSLPATFQLPSFRPAPRVDCPLPVPPVAMRFRHLPLVSPVPCSASLALPQPPAPLEIKLTASATAS